MKKEKPAPISQHEIVDLFRQGLSIEMLAVRVAQHDQIGKKAAWRQVMETIYEEQLRECGKGVGKGGKEMPT